MMKDEMFQELLESVKEAKAIMRGEMKPARVTKISFPDVKGLRARMKLTQAEFAIMLGISVSTLRNWEQKRRIPEGPARVLLKVAEKHPEALMDSIGMACK